MKAGRQPPGLFICDEARLSFGRLETKLRDIEQTPLRRVRIVVRDEAKIMDAAGL
jgi:hypothetical protein